MKINPLIRRNTVFVLLLILLFALRVFYYRTGYKDGDKIRISSTVLSDPVIYPSSQRLKISGLTSYLPVFPAISYGSRITVEGTVEKGILIEPRLISIDAKPLLMSNLRNSIINYYQQVLPEPMAGLLGGIVIGSKGALTNEFYNQTKIAGVTHVVVASGTNITFVVSFLVTVLTLFFKRKKAIVISLIGIVLYLLISGFDAPLVRASLMCSFIFLGQMRGRVVSTWRVFFITCALMLLYDPLWLKDIGFGLSFASTATLILFEKRIREMIRPLPRIFKEGLSTSIAAQIGAAPVLFITFGQFNIISPIINALVLWTVPFIMVLGFVGGLVGLITPALGVIFLWLSYPLLWWFVRLVEFVSNFGIFP